MNRQRDQVLQMLRFKGRYGVSTRDFLNAGISRFSARLKELELDGHTYDKRLLPRDPHHPGRNYLYWLTNAEPEGALFEDAQQPISAVTGRAAA